VGGQTGWVVSSAEVVAEAAKTQPDTKVILTSARSQEMLAPPVRRDASPRLYRKPYQLRDLEQALRNDLVVVGYDYGQCMFRVEDLTGRGHG
jgi:hypothetical protein